MADQLMIISLNLLTAIALVGGLFFMFTGAVGVVRLPDFYSRNHAASKCVTLGISGLLVALVIYVGLGTNAPASTDQAEVAREAAAEVGSGEPVMAAATKALLVIAFIFVATPVGSHMLARAAHLAHVKAWVGTLSDDLAVDRHESEDLFPMYRGEGAHPPEGEEE